MILIGYSGIGKTTIGRAYAEKYGVSFTDTDELIERWTGEEAAKLLMKKQGTYFRGLEHAALIVATEQSQVVSTGGGIVDHGQSFVELTLSGRPKVYLRAAFDVLLLRLVERYNRRYEASISTDEMALAGLQERHNRLSNFYRTVATHEIDTTCMGVVDVVEAIAALGLAGGR